MFVIVVWCFSFRNTTTTAINTYCHTLSLHDALPIEFSVYCNVILSLRCPLCGGKNLTLGFNLSQAENEALRIAGTIEQRAQHWQENGEVGTSSLTIFHHFFGTSL